VQAGLGEQMPAPPKMPPKCDFVFILDVPLPMRHAFAMITTLTGKNQVTVPARLAVRANLHPGTRLDWELAESGDRLIAHVLPDVATLASRLRGAGRAHLRHGQTPVQNLIRERAREDREDA
jgi:hypothetical protein